MKRVVKYSFVALAAMTSTATAFAADADISAQSGDFEPNLASYVVQQALNTHSVKSPSAPRTLKELQLSLRGKSGQESSPFKLSDSRSSHKWKKQDYELRPSFSSLLSPTGSLNNEFGEELVDSSSRIGLTLGAKDGEAKSGLNIEVQSSFKLSLDGVQSLTAFADSSIANREENFGVALGYSGFGVDASITRHTNLFTSDAIGFDVGLSYQDDAFGARLSLSEYTEGADLNGLENEARNVISVELGASYRLTNTLGLTGGVRYYDYGEHWLVNPGQADNAQAIFLGGRLKF
ncbi:porin [Kordiimonas sp. SCSIO 12603]|uniref:outer membrane protein n=1 Tax=Kordiimonas sp. SCSIO 12603 TaxID=2829596 RepID=UPI00210254D0|nr:hypothetical protein [Kordiimonas sp. SCSIO 12603]UTW59071.1 porin [Kordiimonas sp. SCSIO 12603]